MLLKIDAEKGVGPKWRERYQVSGFPTSFLLNPDGTEVDRVVGYRPMPGFLQLVEDYARGIGTLDAMQEELAGRPHDLELKLKIAEKLDQRGEAAAAEERLQEILDADPLNHSGVADDAAAALAMGRFRLSRDPQVLEDLLLSYPGLEQGPEVYNMLIATASREGRTERVKRLLERAIQDYPEDPELLNSYAWMAAELGWNLDQALAAARKAVRLSGEEANVLDTLAEVQFRLGRREEALSTIRRAIERRPGDEYLLKQLRKFRGADGGIPDPGDSR